MYHLWNFLHSDRIFRHSTSRAKSFNEFARKGQSCILDRYSCLPFHLIRRDICMFRNLIISGSPYWKMLLQLVVTRSDLCLRMHRGSNSAFLFATFSRHEHRHCADWSAWAQRVRVRTSSILPARHDEGARNAYLQTPLCTRLALPRHFLCAFQMTYVTFISLFRWSTSTLLLRFKTNSWSVKTWESFHEY